jgi:TPR repeat protein
MSRAETEAEGIDLYVRHLEAQAAGDRALAGRLLQASVALGEPMALHAAAFREPRPEEAVRLYTAAADAGFAASAWNLYLHYKDRGEDDAARTWLQRAAKLGDADAIRVMKAPTD